MASSRDAPISLSRLQGHPVEVDAGPPPLAVAPHAGFPHGLVPEIAFVRDDRSSPTLDDYFKYAEEKLRREDNGEALDDLRNPLLLHEEGEPTALLLRRHPRAPSHPPPH